MPASGKAGGQRTPVLRERNKMNQRWSPGRQPLSVCLEAGLGGEGGSLWYQHAWIGQSPVQV